MLNAGVYLAPSLYKAGFISNAHGDGDIELRLDRAGEVFRPVRQRRPSPDGLIDNLPKRHNIRDKTNAPQEAEY